MKDDDKSDTGQMLRRISLLLRVIELRVSHYCLLGLLHASVLRLG